MKHFLNLVLGLMSICTFAQVTTPQASPSAKTEQVVGLTTISLNYSRPAVKGRTIFGGLEAYDEKWRTGANANTTIEFSDEVIVEGNNVRAGKYAIYSIPGKESWTIYLYANTDNWGLPKNWDEDLVAAEFKVPAMRTESLVESFTIQVKNITSKKADVEIAWENIKVNFSVEVPTDQKVMASIKKTIKEGAKPRDYYSSAVYYLNEDKDIKTAVEWIDKAMEMAEEKPYWMLRQQALIYHKAGMKKDAIKIAKESMKAAEKAGNDDYVKMNKASIEEWK